MLIRDIFLNRSFQLDVYIVSQFISKCWYDIKQYKLVASLVTYCITTKVQPSRSFDCNKIIFIFPIFKFKYKKKYICFVFYSDPSTCCTFIRKYDWNCKRFWRVVVLYSVVCVLLLVIRSAYIARSMNRRRYITWSR